MDVTSNGFYVLGFYRFTTVSNDGLFTSLNKGNDDDV